jgi:riboflavin synthase
MFTGIIESLGEITEIQPEKTNFHFTIKSDLAPELKVDQSVAHNGVCLTVVKIESDKYTVTAIKETLDKTSLGDWRKGDRVNLERCTKIGGRLDGHIVQGHVDQIAKCKAIQDEDGSIVFTFSYNSELGNVTIEKGSITVNGVSLTVVNSRENSFSVAIIPFTLEHTQFKYIKVGSVVNLEFDVVGKYVKRLLGK